MEIPCSRAAAQIRSDSTCGKTTPPARLCVFSISTSVVGGYIGTEAGFRAARNSSSVNTPPAPISVSCTPELAAEAPASCQTVWLSRLTITSSPGRVKTRNATWFAIVPLGSQSAASFPRSSAVRSWRRLMVGSSPNSSLPTGAAAMAARIAADGSVTVSERRSMEAAGLATMILP